ncbi:hypothetical protein GCM10027037_27900 [Mucilaginibacter koreensis]
MLTAAVSSVSAQSAKSKKVNLPDGSQLVYEVAADGKTKDGTYVVNNRENKELWMNGYYKDNNPVGTWTFFNDKYEPALRYNYSQKKITYINNDSFKDIAVNILSDDEAVKKGASIPIPLCSIDELKALISSKVYLLYDNVNSELETKVVAHVNAEGNAHYTISYPTSNGKTEEGKLVIDNGQFKINWLPSKFNDKPIDSEFIMTVSITPANVERWHRFRWDGN